MKNSILIICLLTSFYSLAGVGFITVGSDGNCDYATIQAAVDNGEDQEVRIASSGSPYNESISIGDISIVLKGGYADCSAAEADVMDNSLPTIDGLDGQVVLLIGGIFNSKQVELRHLHITGGFIGVYITTKVDLLIDDTTINYNSSVGMDISAGNPDADVIINDSSISYNGQGMYCTSDNASIRLVGDTLIEENTAQDNGGGVLLADGCQMDVFSPVKIQNNKASFSGGGFYIMNGAQLSLFGGFVGCVNDICYGDNEQPVIIRNNLADSDFNGSGGGGGIAVLGSVTTISAANVQFDGNVAYRGGAVSIANGGTFVAQSYDNGGVGCWSPGRCSQFINNKAYYGGVALVTSGSASLIHSWVQGNRASSGVVGNLYGIGEGELTINNSMLVENGNWGNGGGYADRELFWVGDNTTTLNLESVTIADNSIQEELIENSEANVNVLSSLIANEGVDVYSETNESTSHFECLLSHEKGSFNAGGTVLVAEPQFIDASNDDYRIKPTSPAVDFCYKISFGFMADIEFDEHGLDDPNHANLHGPYDVGADEYIWTDDVLFMDGFESL